MAVALSFVNELDPSYLCVCTIDPMSVLTSIDVVGEVHLRGASMMSFSSSVDHAAAPSISPRCRSSLSVFDFLQRTPISCQTHFTSEIAEGMPEPAASIGLP
jgi:histidinol dehydrogenase